MEERQLKKLLEEMTLEEKVAQLGSVWARDLIEGGRFSREKAGGVLTYGVGEVTRIAGGAGVGPGAAAEIANEIQKFLKEETRCGIPAIIHEECLSGLMAMGATTFPQAIGLASTWNPDLLQRIMAVIRRQMMAIGARQGLAPVLDIVRDPRWGRCEETLGEDPYLVALMGVAYIRGLQGENLAGGVMATPKHFAAHSVPEGGRNIAPVHIGQREFKEVFLFPFEAAVRLAHAASVLNAYHEMDGVPCTASKALLTETLRGKWGFEGIVVSDYDSINLLRASQRVASTKEEAAALALNAGIDIELPTTDCYGEPLIKALNEGKVPMAVVDRAVSRVLSVKSLLGLFDNPFINAALAPSSFDTPQDRLLSLETARESLVLLKNSGVLPLRKDIRQLAVIGPSGDSTRNLMGDYHYTAHLGCSTDAVPVVSVLAGVKKKVSPETVVRHARGCEISGGDRAGFREAVDAAKDSDVILAVMGERSGFTSSDVSGEGRDRADIRLPGLQEELVVALSEVGKPVILVLVNGRPLALGSISDRCAAIIEAWYPGEEGGAAIADVIFGDSNPGGRLPVSLPRHAGQFPVHYSRKPSALFANASIMDPKPLFAFGHGLSYTTFSYDSLSIAPEKVSRGSVSIGFRIKNSGPRPGEETVQLYVSDEVASLSRPVQELKGFKKVRLEPGEGREVTFKLSLDQLAFYDMDMKLAVEPGIFDVMVGGSSEDIKLRGTFEVTRRRLVVPSRRVFFSEVEVSGD